MRLEQVKRDVTSSGMLETSTAKIKATRKIFDMFQDQTYGNVPVAIFRELVANGLDGHRAAGKLHVPIEVTLPTSLDPMVMIKDVGIGMPHHFVMNDFMEYTNGSTKDGSDDDIGGFGIGSKSPLAEVDACTLRVVHDGTLSVYTLFKDIDGIPGIGLQAQTTTTEPNGVEYSFPVEEDRIQIFRDAAQEALQFFNPLPIIHNGSITPPKYTYVGTDWALRPEAGPLGVIMGGIRYPVKPELVSYELRSDTKLSPLLNYGIDITVPIGACGVAMSREGLQYTPKTSESITKALAAILDDVVKTFSTLFEQCDTEWEAMALLYKELGGDQYYRRSARQSLMAANARYRGRELKTEFKLADVDIIGAQAWRIDPKRNRRGVLCPNPKWGGLTDLFGIIPGNVEAVIFDDMEVSPKNKNTSKIKHYVDTQLTQDQVILIVRHDNLDVKDLRKVLRGCPDIVLSSDLPEPPKAGKTATNGVRPRVRMFTYDGTPDDWTTRPHASLNPGNNGKKGVAEIEYAKQPATGICVVMEQFQMPAGLVAKINAGLFAWSELVFVNRGDWSKIKGSFINFDDAWETRLKMELAKHPELSERLAVAESRHLKYEMGLWEALKAARPSITCTAGRPFTKIAELHDRYVQPLTLAQRKLAPFVKAKLPKGLNPEKLKETLDEKQAKLMALLKELDFSTSLHVDIIADYL